MNLRRVLVFLLMVGAGVLAVVLLSDRGTRPSARIEERADAGGDAGRVHVKGAGGGETQVVFGELDFDVLQSVEVAPGRSEDRVAARVHVLSARPDESGAFVAQSPVVHLVDTATGAPRGTLSGESAKFETGSAVAGSVTVDLSHLRAEDWSMHGDVRGEFPLRDGGTAHLAAQDLLVHGAIVRGPGRVTFTRDDATLAGTDLLWDGATGRLTYDADARLTLAATPTRARLDLEAAGGLAWTLPPDAPAGSLGYGELRGGVSGTSGDGSALSADSLVVDADRALTLSGKAALERATPGGGRLRLAASTIHAHPDAAGRLTAADAEGAVRLDETPVGAPPGWMIADRLTLDGNHVHAPGRVTVDRAGFVATGDELDADGDTGRLDFRANGELAVEDGSANSWAGLHLVSPGGMRFTSPPGATDALAAASGELRGPVTGTLPDGTTLATDLLSLDGSRHELRLNGDAHLHRVLHGRDSALAAPHLLLHGDAQGRLSGFTADGGVVVLTGAPGELPWRLETPSLQGDGHLLTAPDLATFTRDDDAVTGTGLLWDEDAGRLQLQRDVRIRFTPAHGGGPAELLAPGGLSWTAPPNARDLLAEGRGELRGPVSGTTADGGSLACDIARLDGPSRTLTLSGAARLARPAAPGREPAELQSDALDVCAHDDGDTLHAATAARFTIGALSGSGTGLLWDERTGQLHFDSALRASWQQPGAPNATLSADAGLDWNLPPGATDPLRQGRGEARGPVHLVQAGRTLDAARLTVDGPGGTTRLLGPATVVQDGAGGGRIAAKQSIDLFAAPDGSPQRLDASGDAQAWLTPADGGAPAHLAADALTLDHAAQIATLTGHALIERGAGDARRGVSAAGVVVRLDGHDQLRSVDADGGVRAFAGELAAESATLTWDVPGDLLRLLGGGRLLSAGAWMTFTTAEVHPDAERFRIEHGELHVDG